MSTPKRKFNVEDVIDEDDMSSDSATKVPTQQSVKAYADGGVSTKLNKSALTSATSLDIDLSAAPLRTLSLSHDPTFTTSNRGAANYGRNVMIEIDANGADRTPTFPAWNWTTTEPTSFTNGSVGLLSLTAFGSAETDVWASFVFAS